MDTWWSNFHQSSDHNNNNNTIIIIIDLERLQELPCSAIVGIGNFS